MAYCLPGAAVIVTYMDTQQDSQLVTYQVEILLLAVPKNERKGNVSKLRMQYQLVQDLKLTILHSGNDRTCNGVTILIKGK